MEVNFELTLLTVPAKNILPISLYKEYNSFH